FDVGSMSQIFNRGHRIRVTIASTGAPYYEVNPNTGEPLAQELPEKMIVAKNSLIHTRAYASRLIAPVRN
ncbi:MAG: CocE/NonD family hydrolase C-terminal non-catalytic domain-containing protein, partial [Xanthomonadales bacterium]|nr:CocE/NonD family hydrolase C-terminal non-catalytic domain-containing protein [Xanthomonadales bacterium]